MVGDFFMAVSQVGRKASFFLDIRVVHMIKYMAIKNDIIIYSKQIKWFQRQSCPGKEV